MKLYNESYAGLLEEHGKQFEEEEEVYEEMLPP